MKERVHLLGLRRVGKGKSWHAGREKSKYPMYEEENEKVHFTVFIFVRFEETYRMLPIQIKN